LSSCQFNQMTCSTHSDGTKSPESVLGLSNVSRQRRRVHQGRAQTLRRDPLLWVLEQAKRNNSRMVLNGYILYFARQPESPVLVTNFIFQKPKLISLFLRFPEESGYRLYFAITGCHQAKAAFEEAKLNLSKPWQSQLTATRNAMRVITRFSKLNHNYSLRKTLSRRWKPVGRFRLFNFTKPSVAVGHSKTTSGLPRTRREHPLEIQARSGSNLVSGHTPNSILVS
jgi:hypothetical protein